jgi:hypothetical protein
MTSPDDETPDPASLLVRGRRREIEGDEAGAESDFTRSAELARDMADPSTEVAALAGLVRIGHAAGRTGEVRVHLEAIGERLAVEPTTVAPIARAEALTEASMVAIERGDLASGMLDEALALSAGEPTTGQGVSDPGSWPDLQGACGAFARRQW